MELTAALVEPAVAEALGTPTVELAGWSVTEIFGGAGQGLGVFRVVARARVDGSPRSCSLILKVAPAEPAETSAAWCHPAREAMAYSTGLLDQLPDGLRAPRCLGYREHARLHLLWLEDLGTESPDWALADYALAARQLGRFNGAYVAGRDLPDEGWLSRDFLRSWLAEGAPAVEELGRHRAHPLVQRIYSPPVFESFAELWRRRETLLRALDALPQVLCHQDAFRRNLFLRAETLVGVDWAFLGPAPIGAELAAFITASVAFLGIDRDRWNDLRSITLDAYRQGLRDAGWNGPAQHPRFGFAASSALRYGPGVIRLVLPALLSQAAQADAERVLGLAFSDIIELWADVAATQAELAAEAFALLDDLE